MQSSSDTQRLVQGALMAALYLVLFLITVYVPFLGLIGLFFLPLPFIVHHLRFGLKSAALVGGVCLFLSPLLAPLPAVFVTLLAVSVGLVMGYYYGEKKAPFLPLLAGMLTYLANYVLAFLFTYLVLNLNMIDVFQQMMEDALIMTEQTAAFLPVPGDENALDVFQEMVDFMVYIFPGLLILSSMLMAGINHAAARPILSRIGFDIQSLPPFRQWNLPKSILFYYLVVLILILLQAVEEGSTWFMLVVNLHLILEILLLLQGLTFVAHFAYVKNIGRILVILAVILSFIPLFSSIIRIVGIIDLGFGLKERLQKAD
ncbi:membrane protein [Caldalkalibacillus thermarum]|uniref:YybS family protein n=1 Tax=Caldalkalibacillus thermarum TaxID=296745 RepID=UPI001667350F|nr:YybS family protein [Caldalkalibacillus thermarum]GGK30263.1 membrane protein [Caldalkalibacillus thermarum]